jgi:hypothetical protein
MDSGANGSDPKPAIELLGVRTLRGDLRDLLLDQIRNMPKPWHLMSEEEQRRRAVHVDEQSTAIINALVDLIAADGRPVINARVEVVNIKTKAIEAKLVLSRSDEQRLALIDAQGDNVMVVLSDPSRFSGERAPAKIDPDQPGLPIETLQVDPNAPNVSVEEGVLPCCPDHPAETVVHNMTGRRVCMHPSCAWQWMPLGGPLDDEDESTPSVDGARELGRQARKHGADEDVNPFAFLTQEAEFDAWLEGYREGSTNEPDGKRRGRPPKDPPQPEA